MAAFFAMMTDNAGNAIVEYAIVAAAITVSLLGVGFAFAQNAGNDISNVNSGLQSWGQNPP